jgi:hypothetical protein
MEISLGFPPTSGSRGAPQTTAGGGTRSDDTNCLKVKEGDIPLVALMPNRENQAKTATATPTLYWYIPSTTATTGEFVVVDENNQEVYYTSFTLPEEPGIVRITIPETAELKAGQKYSWSFMVVCDSLYRNRDKFVEGKLDYEVLDSATVNRLKNATGFSKAELYANSQIWTETLDIVAQMRSQSPNEWSELLNSVGLGGIAQLPFVEVEMDK